MATAHEMPTYFAAAGDSHYLMQSVVYLMDTTKILVELLDKFLYGEHAMWQQKGLWNSIWSDEMIDGTIMH